MKSPPSSTPLSAPRDMDTAGQLSDLNSQVTTLNEHVTELTEQLSTIMSQVDCFKEELELVLEAIARLERSNMAQLEQRTTQFRSPVSAIPQVTMNLNQCASGLTSPTRYQSMNRKSPNTPTSVVPRAVALPGFSTLAPPSSPCSPFVNPSLSQRHLTTTFHTENHSVLPPPTLNAPSIKTPQQVEADLGSISEMGTFYIVTKGREPGIYTDWPKAEALVRSLRHSVYCKKFNKGEAIHVYRNAYEENRVEQVLM